MKSKKLPCPKCQKERLVKLVKHTDILELVEGNLSFQTKAYQCQTCLGLMDTVDTLDTTLRLARKAFVLRFGKR